MRAWLMDSYDGIGKLRVDEVPDPQPAPERPQPAAAGDRQVQLELVAGRALLRDRRQHAAA